MTLDRDPERTSQGPPRIRGIEQSYARKLRSVAHHVGKLIAGFPPGDADGVPSIRYLLDKYAEALVPWARVTAAKMLGEVNDANVDWWRLLGNHLSRGIATEIRTAPTGERLRQLLGEQVTLITSIPTEAAERVHRLTTQALEDSSRYQSMIGEIMRSGEVAQSRAVLIARTETSRTSALLTQSRAEHIGSPGYFWETARDGSVRPSHRVLQGRFVEWKRPPKVDDFTAHAGCTPNCRCWTRVVL